MLTRFISLALITFIGAVENNLASILILAGKALLTSADFWIFVEKKKLHDEERRNNESHKKEPSRKDTEKEDGG